MFILLFVIGPTVYCFSQGLGNGQDGSPNISGIINRYTYLTKNASRCDGELFVANTNGFFPNDLILIIQMQGASINNTNDSTYGSIVNYNNCGNYEYAKIKSVDGNTKLVLQYALLRDYSASGKTQVIRVPQYQSPTITGTITCPPWDGSTGGIVAIDAIGTITMNANIDAMGLGFRGGQGQQGAAVLTVSYDYIANPDPTYYSLKGEGIASYGVPPSIAGRGAPANGGGGGNVHTTGGGGGGNSGCGGDGGWGEPVDSLGSEKLIFGIGGHSLQYSNSANKIFMGGGGGSGHNHDGDSTSGANGGGIVFITANSISGNGNYIYVSGDDASGTSGDGAGGGGAGGTVIISVNQFISSLNINADGGDGGSSMFLGAGPGGGGGGGTVWLSSSSLPPSLTVSYNGGTGGTAGGNFYGATNGCIGNILYNLSIPINNTYPAVPANFTPLLNNLPDVSFLNNSQGANSYLWYFGDGATSNSFQPQHTYAQAGLYEVVLISSNAMCSDTAKEFVLTGYTNVFTPNGDGVNDYFSFEKFLNDGSSLHFDIYNRWGEKIFEGDQSKPFWDGTLRSSRPADDGTYFYVVTIHSKSETIVHKGFITLMR
jgi:gliding motility-associated-like protein